MTSFTGSLWWMATWNLTNHEEWQCSIAFKRFDGWWCMTKLPEYRLLIGIEVLWHLPTWTETDWLWLDRKSSFSCRRSIKIDPFFGRSIEIENVEKIQRSIVTQHWICQARGYQQWSSSSCEAIRTWSSSKHRRYPTLRRTHRFRIISLRYGAMWL